MTAYEVSERMKQFRRENLPLFAPIEAEDNGQTCELAFEIAMGNNLLGSPYDVPPSLRGRDVEFKFESPLTASENDEIAQRYAQTREMLAGAIELDPSVGHDIDLSAAIRDAGRNGRSLESSRLQPQRYLRSQYFALPGTRKFLRCQIRNDTPGTFKILDRILCLPCLSERHLRLCSRK